jgi:uncharacterized repeat protein (TIGR04138 family)
MPKHPKKPIDQLVREVARYPIEAYAFVQEAIGFAAQHVHGPMGEDETAIAHWMSQNDIDYESLRHLHQTDKLPREVAEAVDRIGGPEQMNRHVSGQELCMAVCDLALSRWGIMARCVLESWNVMRTEDIGEIIFTLVENDWLQKEPTDTIEDFKAVYSFSKAFDKAYRIKLT